MKTCPSCRRSYADESLVFCLDDGTKLVRDGAAFDSDATWNLQTPASTLASPRPAPPTAQSTIRARPEQFQTPSPEVPRRESRSSALPWVFAIVLVLGASGVLIAWFMTRGAAGDTSSKSPDRGGLSTPLPAASTETVVSKTPGDKPAATPTRATKEAEKPPPATPPPERAKPAFAMLNNTSFNGSRITYYQRTSFALCQADCAANANCKGLTWIRPGAYNPSDPGMCYLMSAVTQRVAHECCISAVRN